MRAPGVYVLRHGKRQTPPFRIAADVYRQGVWQPTLETFFPAQMCHVQVLDRGRVWHGLCHMDDALQPPPNHDLSFIEDYRQGPTTDTPFAAFQHIPGLDSGGWHDAGDFDLATGSQSAVVLLLSLARENFAVDSDQTTVDAQRREVFLHVPDGKPDILQQIAHGVENLLNSYRVAGHSFAGISDPSQEQYQKQGDAASITDNRIFDPSLEARGDPGRPLRPARRPPGFHQPRHRHRIPGDRGPGGRLPGAGRSRPAAGRRMPRHGAQGLGLRAGASRDAPGQRLRAANRSRTRRSWPRWSCCSPPASAVSPPGSRRCCR